MRWEDERYVRVYTRDTAEWLALGWEGQSLLMLLLRKADRAGIIHTGKAGVRGVAALSGMPLEVAQRALALLLEDGCLKAMEGGYVFPNFLAAQEAKSSDAQRKREQRARDREKALAGGASGSSAGLDAEAALSRASGQASRTLSRPGVTRPPDNVTGVTDSVTPSRAVPSLAVPSASQAPTVAAPPGADGEELPDATDEAEEVRPALVLEAQDAEPPKPEKRSRTPSVGEALYARLESQRQQACEMDAANGLEGVHFIPSRWAFSRQNKQLGPIAKTQTSDPEGEWARFSAAWGAFLDDTEVAARLDEPYALDYFLRCRGRYEGRAMKGAA